MGNRNASNRPGSVVGLVAGIILSLLGLITSPVLLVIGIVLIVQNRTAFAGGKAGEPSRYKSAPPKPKPPVRPRPAGPAQSRPGVSYQFDARDHNHIVSTGLSAERRLEQLEVMKNAGLIDKEEYELRLRKILSGR